MLLLLCAVAPTHAAKATPSRTIAIVFDNSGSMYQECNQAWCRATYAMEVFASMLNPGDTLLIYPMHPIQIDGEEYTMHDPFRLQDAAQAIKLRDIYTPKAVATPIESIDCAVEGLKQVTSGQKCLIVLTDGDSFYRGSPNLHKMGTVPELDKRIQANAGPDMMFMYLGIGEKACMPSVEETDYFKKKRASDTADVLSHLTDLCNTIFGRDTLPDNHINGLDIDFDISMSKLIVFVQGENIDDLSVTDGDGKPVGTLVSTQKTSYSTKGAGSWSGKTAAETPTPDTSLQGMMVTYEDCALGTYTLSFTGNATSKEIYYEPDVDMSFVFTDDENRNVDLNKLYAGAYKVTFGMKDAKTGELIEKSDLLGTPHYRGSYFINDVEHTFTADGHSGEEAITLAKDDTFRANLTSTFLSGYTITKASTDFGWPQGGVMVTPRPADKFSLELEVPKSYIVIPDLKKDPVVTLVAKPLVKATPLTAEQMACTTLQVECGSMEQEIIPRENDFLIRLTPPRDIAEGDYSIKATATYADAASEPATAERTVSLTFSNTSLLVKWAIRIILLLLLAYIIYRILHIRVLPKYAHTTKRDSTLSFDGDDVSQHTGFSADIKKKSAVVKSKYGGRTIGVSMSVTPGDESYLYKKQKDKSALVSPASVKKIGPAKNLEVQIGNVRFVTDEATGKLVPAVSGQKPFLLRDGTSVKCSCTVNDGGIDKDFDSSSKLFFKKHK